MRRDKLEQCQPNLRQFLRWPWLDTFGFEILHTTYVSNEVWKRDVISRARGRPGESEGGVLNSDGNVPQCRSLHRS